MENDQLIRIATAVSNQSFKSLNIDMLSFEILVTVQNSVQTFTATFTLGRDIEHRSRSTMPRQGY